MKILILSGWTQPADALAHVADGAVTFDYSDYATPAAAIEALKEIKPTHAVAWSLGGQLALRAIAAGALAPKHLTLIAAPMQFVRSSNSPLEGESNPSSDSVGGNAAKFPPTDVRESKAHIPLPLEGGAKEPASLMEPNFPAMDATTYGLFRESYMRDAARTKTRFHGLIAKGDRDMRRVMELLGHHHDVENTARWLPWLEELAAHTLDVAALASAPPTLIIHGMNDAIVPHAQSEHLARHLPHAQLNSWAEVGHAPHVHDAARLRAEIAAHRTQHGVA